MKWLWPAVSTLRIQDCWGALCMNTLIKRLSQFLANCIFKINIETSIKYGKLLWIPPSSESAFWTTVAMASFTYFIPTTAGDSTKSLCIREGALILELLICFKLDIWWNSLLNKTFCFILLIFSICKNKYIINVLWTNVSWAIVSVLWAGYKLDFVVTNHAVYSVNSSMSTLC